MAIFGRSVRRLFALRRTVRTLDRIASALEEQNALLARLADHFIPDLSADQDLASTGPSFSRDREQADILGFVERTVRDVGREPTDEEVLEFLSERDRPH